MKLQYCNKVGDKQSLLKHACNLFLFRTSGYACTLCSLLTSSKKRINDGIRLEDQHLNQAHSLVSCVHRKLVRMQGGHTITLIQIVNVCLTACWMLLYHSKKRIIDSIWLEEQHETKQTCEVRFRSKNTLTEMAGISIRSWYTVGFWIDPDKLKPSYLKTRKPLDQKTRKT